MSIILIPPKLLRMSNSDFFLNYKMSNIYTHT